jgi:hypothetical protein
MEYNKNITGKGIPKNRPNPYRSGGGPRDQQRRLQAINQPDTSVGSAEAIINELRAQIAQLTQELIKKPKSGEFTAEEVDSEIRKAVIGAVKETQDNVKHEINKLTNRNIELEKELAVLKAALQSKETGETAALTKKIEELTMAVAASKGGEIELDPDRPKMEEVFIDPLSKGAGNNLESHVDIKDSSPIEKVKVDEQVDKLKGLLGKLPSFKK